MSNLQSRLDSLARTFTEQIVEAIRGVSLHELSSGGAGAFGNGRSPRPADKPAAFASSGAARKAVTAATTAFAKKSVRSASNGRLPRRSAEEIEALLGKVVELVKSHKDGFRAEEIRSQLGLQSKEMPRILKQGVASKALRTKGQKRATTYFVK